MVRRLGIGSMASVLAFTGLVAFATEASAHDDVVESVTASCNAPGTGAGTTLTWRLYNDWAVSETGTFWTSLGTLSTTALSIAASPTNNATPPAAASQTFTQTLTATELAALSPASTISVNWSATWTDGSARTGTLSTTLSSLDLLDGCIPLKTTPTVATTLAAPRSSTLGHTWGDSATVTGRVGGPAPAGSVDFYVCRAWGQSCGAGGTLQGKVGSPSSSSGNASTYTLPAESGFTPRTVGTYCFYTTYSPSNDESYRWASGPAECFTVGQAYPGIATTLVQPWSSTVGNSWSDSATVSGVWGGGTPFGSVSFYVCKAAPSPTSTRTCNDPTGTLVGTVSTATGITDVSATYDLSPTTYAPSQVGTYCFYTLYEPSDRTENYFPVWGPSECFTVGPATPSVATTLVSPSSSAVGNVWSDSATVTGDATNGVPTGSVSFSVCKVASGHTACTSGGTLVSTLASPSSSSGDTSTYDLMPTTYAPPNVGTYCFFSTYIPAAVGLYTTASGPPECFTVTSADPQFGTQQSGSTSGSGTIKLGGSLTDTAVVTGNSVGGAPTGTVSFRVCATGSSMAVCPNGTVVGSPVVLTASGDVGTATSASFKPSAAGTYCFAADYTPAANANYVAATDNMSGMVQSAECFVVVAVTTAATTVTPTTTKASVPLAFTGARLAEEWMTGLGVLLLGAALVVLARWRRRIPRHRAR